jgi:hypothetical protein
VLYAHNPCKEPLLRDESYLFDSAKRFQINFFAALHKKSLTHHLIALKYDLLQRTKYGAADTN